MAAVPRERFVPPELAEHAWDDAALPIGSGQTISQPFVVARMCEALGLRGDERVLDVGTGSGYHAAVLGQLCHHVWSVERHAELSEAARSALARAGIGNVTCLVADGCEGLPELTPFDAINVAAAVHGELPPALLDQLGPSGRLVAPIGTAEHQRLVVLRRRRGGFEERQLEPVRFVPLVAGLP